VRLHAGGWALEIRERGGRVTSLKHDGRELLDQGVGVDDPDAEGFVEAGAFGWDELVPTVDRTETFPDHGEAWRLLWRTDRQSDSACQMSCDGRLLPWRLERTIELTGEGLRADYSMRNTGDRALPGYWCSHILWRYEAGMEVDVGEKLMAFAEGKSAKFFLPKGSVDRARLRWRDGAGVQLLWDAAAAPHCGVWICNGDLGGYRQVAIEPATGGGDRPDSDEPPPALRAGESLSWWLEIRPL
jgi:galactose mutarotase-like enzyme